MKFEKRADGGETTPAAPEHQETGKKPVIIYIIILFLAAFLLMLLSLLASQRNNTETIGKLHDTFMGDIQAKEEELIDLRQQVSDREKELEAAEDNLAAKDESIAELEKEIDALLALYNLQQEYAAGNLDGCRILLQEISDEGLEPLLPTSAQEGIPSPAQQYQELREAILNS